MTILRHPRLRRFAKKIIGLFAEWEARELAPGDPAPWRRRFLRIQGVKFQSGWFIGPGFWIIHGHNLTLGERCSLGSHAKIAAHAPITIGHDFLAACGLTLNSGDHDVETLALTSAPIRIGRRVWCGANVTILSGATIGDHAVIGAGALVRGDIPPYSVAVGVPARVVRRLPDPRSTT
jgi:acetyltransferase-like isoleucine patch superfamily enzyme